jgi:hypothetical protein
MPAFLRAALLLCGLTLWIGGAAAAPIVDLKSRSKLQLDAVRREGDQVVVSGRLYDPATMVGLPDALVELSISGLQVSTRTDAEGRFTKAVDAPPGEQAIEMTFAGDGTLDKAELREIADPALAAVTLSFEATPVATGVILRVTATSGGGEMSAPLTLFADRPGSDEMKPIAQMTAGEPLEITRKQLGGAGTRRFRAEYVGDDNHQPASVAGTYELTSTSKTSLALADGDIAYEDDVVATGAVLDEDGIGLIGASVSLVSGDRRLAQGVTGEGGRYRFEVEGEILGTGQLSLQTMAEPGGSVQASRSEPAMIKVAAPQPVPITYTVIAFLATGLAAGAFFAARNKPWKRFAKEAPPSQQVVVNAEAQQGGLVAAKPSLVSTLRRASDLGFSGAVRDTVRGRPVAGAQVVLRRRPAGAPPAPAPPVVSGPEATAIDTIFTGGAEYRAISGDDGSFALEDLEGGDWAVSVSALSHITETFPIFVPHRGELRGVRVDLVPVREKVFLLYQRAAMPALPDPRLWGVWSPRQVVDHVRATKPSPALAKLTDFVEEVYFSARPIEESVLPAAKQRVDAAIAERA